MTHTTGAKPLTRQEPNKQNFIELFGKEDTRLEIYGKYIGATASLMMTNIQKNENSTNTMDDLVSKSGGHSSLFEVN